MYHKDNAYNAHIRAILGPTNTGKTWLAFDRMLSFRSGIMGFPLRLLARENYDKAVKIKGVENVALITGEEKILPPKAQYFFCTTESMPIDRIVDFVAVDEIQLCTDPDRGHIFTDRLLYARGRYETMFMGAQLIETFIKLLVPKIEVETRDRLSTLSWGGKKSIERLPPRSAIVSFSASDVYATAELVRRQRGGAAVVLGALSPRTRNAQVAMYQAGEVDWLIATDAIGMGLNMDINHVAFSSIKKFDGHKSRMLTPQELAQIAGRAGRGGNDGTFGTTGGVAKLEDNVIEAIENHEFSVPKHIFWRNSNLQFGKLSHLIASLKQPPPKSFLIRPRDAEDEAVLQILAQDKDVEMRIGGEDTIRCLWEVARIPDFSKTHVSAHAQMLKPLLVNILDTGYISSIWMQKQFDRLNKEDSSLEQLIQQIAAVRTLTYIAYQKQWVSNADHWQAQTRALEDRLSDRLHESLTKRFVDRKNAVLMSRLKQHNQLYAIVHNNGDVDVEGHYIGKLEGFVFKHQKEHSLSDNFHEKAVQNAVNQALRVSLQTRIKQLLKADDTEFTLENQQLLWNGHVIAQLIKSDDIYRPIIRLIPTNLLNEKQQMRIVNRLQDWLKKQLNKVFAWNIKLERYCDNHSHLRSLGYNMYQYLGITLRQYTGSVSFTEQDVHYLATRFQLYFGRMAVYIRKSFKPETMWWRKNLVQLYFQLPAMDEDFQGDIIHRPKWPKDMALYMGYIALKDSWVRADFLEKLIKKSRSAKGLSFMDIKDDLRINEKQTHMFLKQLGFIRMSSKKDEGALYQWRHRIKGSITKEEKQPHNPDSPFAILQELEITQTHKPSKPKRKKSKNGRDAAKT